MARKARFNKEQETELKEDLDFALDVLANTDEKDRDIEDVVTYLKENGRSYSGVEKKDVVYYARKFGIALMVVVK